MSLKKDLIKNTGMVGISKIIENILAYIIIILISRYLGAEGLGQYSFIFAFVGIFFVFADLGLSQLMIKDLARTTKNINKYVSNIITLKGILLIISYIIYFITIFFIGKTDLIIPLIIAGISQTINLFSTPLYSLAISKQKGKIVSATPILEKTITLFFAVITLAIYKNLTLFLIGHLIAQIVRLTYLVITNKKEFVFKPEIDKKFLLKLLKKSYPFLLIASFALIYMWMDTILLGFMQGDIVTGWYNAPYKLINILNLIPAVLLTFSFPTFSKYFSKNKKIVKELLEKIIAYSLYLIIPIIVGVLLVGNRILEFVYGFGSIESSIAFKILIIAELFVFLTTILGQFIAATNKQLVFAKIAGIGAVINIILNFLLIPKYSLYGAGFATLITYFVMFIIMFIYTKKKLLKFKFFRYLIIPIIATFLMYLILINILHLHLILIVGICAVVYIFLIFGYEHIKIKSNKKSKNEKNNNN